MGGGRQASHRERSVDVVTRRRQLHSRGRSRPTAHRPPAHSGVIVMSQLRLQKILSMAGVASRRAAETLIAQGRVTRQRPRGDGARARRPIPRPTTSAWTDAACKGAEPLRYLLLHKPRGYVTTRSDPSRRPTVIDLLRGVREYVYPVGRLDYDSEGLLLLTNDGDLAAGLTHPRHGLEREYEAWVLGDPDEHDLERLRRGVLIDGRRTRPRRCQSSIKAAASARGRPCCRSRFARAETGRCGRCARRSATRWTR